VRELLEGFLKGWKAGKRPRQWRRQVEVEGRTYVFRTNTLWENLGRYPAPQFHIEGEAVDQKGRILPGYVAVYELES
jgi:hypothetical protein